jgi:methyl-accepting chemotaxis protein WspA
MASLRNLSIRTRLLGVVLFSTANLGLVLVVCWYLLATYRVDGPVYARITQERKLAEEIEPAVLAIHQPVLLLQMMTNATRPADLENLERDLKKAVQTYHKRIDHWRQKLPEGDVKQGILVEARKPAEEVFTIAETEFLPLLKAKQPEKARAVFEERIRPLYEAHLRHTDMALELIRKQILQLEHETSENTTFWLIALVVVSAGSLLAVLIVGWATLSSVLTSTRQLLQRVRELAAGESDLTARVQVHGRDEISQLAEGINAMLGKIQQVVQRVRESSIQLLSTASEIAATARQQETTMQELGSSTSEIAAAVREISATSKELAGTMNEVNERANLASTLANAGRARLGSMEATMHQLVDSTASISSKLSLIREKADNINLLVSTITRVADQTNLLSINAAIEAEKAGEYGRGFLVVAREIRRLADQTAVATLDIETVVRLMHDAVSAGVMQMDKFSEEVRTGVSRVAEINDQTGQIIEEVRVLGERFQRVNEGMRNQSVGAEQINEAMVQVSAGTRQTVASLEEFNRATAHLRESVEMLNQEVARFKV